MPGGSLAGRAIWRHHSNEGGAGLRVGVRGTGASRLHLLRRGTGGTGPPEHMEFPLHEDFDQARSLFLEGVAHFEAQQFEAAESRFVASLQRLPGRASTRLNLAATWLHLGRPAEALAELEAVLTAEPQHLDAWCHRSAALAELGRDAESLACADHVIAIDPGDATAWFRRGHALDRLRRFGDAQPAFERLLELQPQHAEAWFRLGQLQQRQGRLAEALASQDKALALAPSHAAAWSQRGSLLRELGRNADATMAFERAMALGANAEVHRFFLASLGNEPRPANAPRAYVRALFDDYADSFDKHLLEGLGYQAHRRLVTPLAGLRSQPFDSALDLGCGTGLCGPLLRPIARHLEGLDLSRAMLDQAAARGVYDRLVQADLVEHLQQTPAHHDLVIAADVFIYVGDLEPVFDGVVRVLRPGGVFCFSVEHTDGQRPVALNTQLRYEHSLPYLQGLALHHGLRLLRVDAEPLREHRARALPGLYVYLGR
jgi:predicted TPR repeat methyltransferase